MELPSNTTSAPKLSATGGKKRGFWLTFLLGPGSEKKDLLVNHYDTLIKDLTLMTLGGTSEAYSFYQRLLKQLTFKTDWLYYQTYQRAWVLKFVCQKLLSFGSRRSLEVPLLSTAGQQLDPSDPLKAPSLHDFGLYFRKLKLKDQILCILKERHLIPNQEIAIALNSSANAIKIRRKQIYRYLEAQLWTQS